jgi:hypothetical protein
MLENKGICEAIDNGEDAIKLLKKKFLLNPNGYSLPGINGTIAT